MYLDEFIIRKCKIWLPNYEIIYRNIKLHPVVQHKSMINLPYTDNGLYSHPTPENKRKAVKEEWTMRYRDWATMYSQLTIFFEDHVAKYV